MQPQTTDNLKEWIDGSHKASDYEFKMTSICMVSSLLQN
jgi:hypothetical protein